MKNGFESTPSRGASDIQKQSFEIFGEVQEELSSALSLYWTTAGRILDGSGVRLLGPSAGYFDLKRNFFSALFLYSYHRAGISAPRRALYAAMNQCLRGMVTGCDNLLDDEYKKTLDTDLPEHGVRFRSVLDMLTSDRVLFDLLFQAHRRKELSAEEVRILNALSLKTLVRSGAQEASEESGVRERLRPEKILKSVHHFKTGLLFQSPWAAPSALENLEEDVTAPLLTALYDIGMGCQIMDDMVDLHSDLKQHRHNYVASLIHHCADPSAGARLDRMAASPKIEDNDSLLSAFPDIGTTAARTAVGYLEKGLSGLLSTEPAFRISAAIGFLAQQIGAERWIFPQIFPDEA